jgi:hypothetical protein
MTSACIESDDSIIEKINTRIAKIDNVDCRACCLLAIVRNNRICNHKGNNKNTKNKENKTTRQQRARTTIMTLR